MLAPGDLDKVRNAQPHRATDVWLFGFAQHLSTEYANRLHGQFRPQHIYGIFLTYLESVMDRREFLSVAGSAFLAGCADVGRIDGGGTDTAGSRPRWLSAAPLDGWAMGRADQRRTGRAPNASLSPSGTPQVRWETPVTEHDMGDVIATEYGVFTGTGEDTSTVVFRRNPTKNHRVTAGGHRGSEPAIRDGVLYCGGSSVSAIDVVRDRVEWAKEMAPMPQDRAEKPVPVRGTPVVDDDTVYAIGLWTGDAVSVFALSAASGAIQWTRELADKHVEVDYEPVLAGETVVAVVPDPGTDALTIAAIGRSSGSERWQHSVPIPGGYDHVYDVSFAPVVAGGRVLFRLGDRIYAVDLQTGAPDWEYSSEHGQFVSPIAADDKLVYAATRPGDILALRHQTGELAWTTSVAGRCSEPVAVGSNHLVAVSQREDGAAKGIYPPSTVTLIEKSTGDTRWTFEHDGAARAPVIGEGSIFVGFWTVRNGAWSSITALG